MTRPKLADVAARAGVSLAAVSLVLNGNDAGNIAPATRDRILDAARDLHYQPNSVAQSLRRQRTHAVGLVTDAIATSPFAGGLVAGAMDAATERGYAMLVVDSQSHIEREQQGVDELARRQVDGLLYATMGLRIVDALPSTRLPMVLANCMDPGAAFDAVYPDNVLAASDAVDYLLGLGHRRVTMLTAPGPQDPDGGNVAGPMRSRAFRAAMKAAGRSPQDTPVVRSGWSINAGYQASMRLLTDSSGQLLPAAQRPTAIWALTDRTATGVLFAAAHLGIDVPGDLSVVGMDDQDQLAAFVVPPLTTLALPHRAMGEAAMHILLDYLGRDDPAGIVDSAPVQRIGLRCPLVVRGSAGPPPPD